jgi:hypothetical protein
MISTRDLSELPDVEGLLRLTRSLATLDAILCPEWEFRYFSFNDEWEEGERLALMRNGEGDDWLALFTPDGAVIKGYAVSSPMAKGSPWPGLLDQLPPEFAALRSEDAFSAERTTFCLWRGLADPGWRRGAIDFPAGDDPDGSANLLRFLDGRPETYKQWADEYFGHAVNLAAIERIYRYQPLTSGLVTAVNPEASFTELCDEIREIGYPIG